MELCEAMEDRAFLDPTSKALRIVFRCFSEIFGPKSLQERKELLAIWREDLGPIDPELIRRSAAELYFEIRKEWPTLAELKEIIRLNEQDNNFRASVGLPPILPLFDLDDDPDDDW